MLKTKFIALLAVVFSFELNAQPNYSLSEQIKLNPLSIKETKEIFSESYVHLGVEYGPFWNLTDRHPEFNHSIYFFIDGNLSERVVFYKIEIGGVIDEQWHGGGFFGSLGLNYSVFKEKRHAVYLFAGLAIGVYYPILFAVVNPKYVFMIDEHLGFSVGVRYMPQIGFDQHFLSFSGGLQFFINKY